MIPTSDSLSVTPTALADMGVDQDPDCRPVVYGQKPDPLQEDWVMVPFTFELFCNSLTVTQNENERLKKLVAGHSAAIMEDIVKNFLETIQNDADLMQIIESNFKEDEKVSHEKLMNCIGEYYEMALRHASEGLTTPALEGYRRLEFLLQDYYLVMGIDPNSPQILSRPADLVAMTGGRNPRTPPATYRLLNGIVLTARVAGFIFYYTFRVTQTLCIVMGSVPRQLVVRALIGF